MGVFDDKKFDELDWLSQATEPIEASINHLLAKFPDEIDIDFKTLSSAMQVGWRNIRITKSELIERYVRRNISADMFPKTSEEKNMLYNCFDFEKRILDGKVSIVKTKNTFDNKELEKIFGLHGIEKLTFLNIDQTKFSRANEVMEILGKCDEGLTSKSSRTKRRGLMVRLREIMSKNEWNLRDVELANQVGLWIIDYIQDGNVAAFRDLCRLKVMTHKGLPIYSMETME